MTAMELIRFQNTVGGRLNPVSATFESFDPYTGKPWALIPRDGKAEVDAAVESAKAAFKSKEWAGITPTARGKLMVHLADVIAENAERLAAVETRDNGKLIAEMTAQLCYIPEWFRYFGGLRGRPANRQTRHARLHSPRAARRDCRHRAVELPAVAADLETRAAARGRQHRRHQALGACVGLDT